MKAYILGIKGDDDAGNEIVFAETAKEARKMVSLTYDSWIDVYARRCKEFDGMENSTPKEMLYKCWKEGWWFHQSPLPDEATDEEFDKWYEENFVLN